MLKYQILIAFLIQTNHGILFRLAKSSNLIHLALLITIDLRIKDLEANDVFRDIPILNDERIQLNSFNQDTLGFLKVIYTNRLQYFLCWATLIHYLFHNTLSIWNQDYYKYFAYIKVIHKIHYFLYNMGIISFYDTNLFYSFCIKYCNIFCIELGLKKCLNKLYIWILSSFINNYSR